MTANHEYEQVFVCSYIKNCFEEALQRTREIIRRKHLALSTEDVYCAWLRRYSQVVKKCPPHTPSEQKARTLPHRFG